MVKNFTQNELVTFNFGESDEDGFLGGAKCDERQMLEIVDQIKNLRVRPSLASVRNIMQYAQMPAFAKP